MEDDLKILHDELSNINNFNIQKLLKKFHNTFPILSYFVFGTTIHHKMCMINRSRLLAPFVPILVYHHKT